MMIYVMAFVASFSMTFLKAFQTRNVVACAYKLSIITSVLISVAEIAIITSVVKGGWDVLIATGIGGVLGVTLSMYSHKRFVR